MAARLLHIYQYQNSNSWSSPNSQFSWRISDNVWHTTPALTHDPRSFLPHRPCASNWRCAEAAIFLSCVLDQENSTSTSQHHRISSQNFRVWSPWFDKWREKNGKGSRRQTVSLTFVSNLPSSQIDRGPTGVSFIYIFRVVGLCFFLFHFFVGRRNCLHEKFQRVPKPLIDPNTRACSLSS